MRVTRKLWLPTVAVMPAAAALRRIMRHAGRRDIGTQRLGECMMARHRMVLAAFLMQPDLPARPFGPKILDLHLQRGADPREGNR